MGQPVTVWFQPEQKPRGPYLVSVLGSLGYKTRSKVVKDGFALYTAVNNPRLKMQAFPTGWGADYPATSNFFVPTFTCASFRLGRNFNGNASGFCNPRIDREIAHAQALQTSDPTAASHLWSKVDREITNQAPVVAFYNPRQLDFVSHRVGDYQYNENLDQLWVR